MDAFTLEGQVVLVVGASSGIGAATARLVNVLGATTVLASRSADGLRATQAGLAHPEASGLAVFNYLDAPATVAALVVFDRIDHVVVTAVADENKKRGAFLDLSSETMRASFDKF